MGGQSEGIVSVDTSRCSARDRGCLRGSGKSEGYDFEVVLAVATQKTWKRGRVLD
ncbi:MAG: hypothetical protein WB869_18735 [Candidatus Acidiferrales bacterium]